MHNSRVFIFRVPVLLNVIQSEEDSTVLAVSTSIVESRDASCLIHVIPLVPQYRW